VIPKNFKDSKAGRAILAWLLAVALMVALMMLIGAITRLTESGLSMVEWRPFIGVLPPFSEAEWSRIFDLYRQTSEYRLENAGMPMSEFKMIFWWEYIHRLWGRFIGLAFAVPLAWFLWRGYIPKPLKPHLFILLCLGGLQGIIGWWMVNSGFVDRHDVSQYRLVVHLAVAFLILGYLIWLIAEFFERAAVAPATPDTLRRGTTGFLLLVAVTIISGGLVAGLGAGFDYNTWPLMADNVVPAGLYDSSPWWLAAFEDVLSVQFDHRILAYLTFILAMVLLWRAKKLSVTRWQYASHLMLAIAVLLQLLLGIATLLTVVSLPLAVLHQAGAILLFSSAILARHACR
jgi:cytochrome c oxidase assembly protein subunit 15